MISLLIYVVLVVLVGYLAAWILRTLAPGHPAIVDNIIWVVVVLVVILQLARAFGVVDLPVPRVR